MSLQPRRNRRAGLEAGLESVRRQLALQKQGQLPVLGRDDVDRRYQRLDRPVGVSRDGQRVRQQASGGCERLRFAERLDGRREVIDRASGSQA
jgi:hypothetical protein